MTIFKPGDQSDQERVVSSVENQDMQVEISDVLDVQESEKEVAERASAQELGDKIFLQMQGEYQNIIPKEQKEKFWNHEKEVFDVLYKLLVDDMKGNGDDYNKYGPKDPLVAEILNKSNFLFADGEFDGLRCGKWISQFYDKDLESKPKGRKGIFKSWERAHPYEIYTDRKDGEIDKSIYVRKRSFTPKEERRRFKGRRTH